MSWNTHFPCHSPLWEEAPRRPVISTKKVAGIILAKDSANEKRCYDVNVVSLAEPVLRIIPEVSVMNIFDGVFVVSLKMFLNKQLSGQWK